jgi:RNA polymerase sigma-70 factor (ECF subfamily)
LSQTWWFNAFLCRGLIGVGLQSDMTLRASFSEFVDDNESELRHALVGHFGSDLGRDAAAQALLYGLEHWERVGGMENPTGYLFRVGRRWGGRQQSRRVRFRIVEATEDPWFEPGLAAALEGLPVKQRVAVVLRHGSDMDYSEIARLTNSTESAVRKNVERGLAGLRRSLEVDGE